MGLPNNTWVVPKLIEKGEAIVKRGPIAARTREVGYSLHGMNRAQAKQTVYEELQQWLQAQHTDVALCAVVADAAPFPVLCSKRLHVT